MHAIFTQGLKMPPLPVNNGSLYVLEMTDPHKGPRALEMEDDYLATHPDFTPHGIDYWITNDGAILLYVVTHWINYTDSVEVFQYFPDKGSVKYVRSIYEKSMVNLNNVVVFGEDDLYVSHWKYFNNEVLHILEQLLYLPLTNVYHIVDGKLKSAVSGLCSANGINKSRNGRSVDIFWKELFCFAISLVYQLLFQLF